MACVIERHGHSVDVEGLIHYHESSSTYEQAERIAGRKLDRRRNYAIIEGEVCESASWTDDCSGCTDIGDYGTKYGPTGCTECGYTGKRRNSQWIPIALTETFRD